jgi:hypothetical protein
MTASLEPLGNIHQARQIDREPLQKKCLALPDFQHLMPKTGQK